MKKTAISAFAIALLFSFTNLVMAQENKDEKKRRKIIEVEGKAEKEIIPDEIYFNISLQEYKDGSRKTDIETLEKQLVKAVKDAGIAREDLRIENASSYNHNYWRKKKDEEIMLSKQYTLKLKDLHKINQVMNGVDAKGIQNTYIREYSHSNIEQYRRELKIEALKSAKDKAQYLLESIGENLGGVRFISEQSPQEHYPQPRMYANKAMSMEDMAGGSPEIDFKTIKISSTVYASFEIK